MKKIWIIIANVFIMVAMLIFVVIYSYVETKDTTKRQIEHFEKTTITMELVTENYLEGEQRICDVWAHYINSKEMSIEEATSFIRISHVLKAASAHIVYTDTLTGLSTKSKTDDYGVSYERLELLNDLSWIHDIGTSINVSRTYTNPVNGEQSIAFCNYITLHEDGKSKNAILLRVLPIAELMDKWVFPQEEFENSEFSIIDADGDYIIEGQSYEKSNFFEFYKSYNSIDPTKSKELFDKLTKETGSIIMLNSRGEECILAYTPFDATGDMSLLSLMPMKYLNVNTENWLLIGFISIGLLLLFIFDSIFMLHFNKKLKYIAREADVANKAKTDFLSAMSHDIRTPMNAIIGLTTISEKNIDDKKLVSDNLRKITLASNHLLTLINDILDISKVESGKLTLSPKSFSIVDTVENLMNISQPMVKEKNINFNFRVHKIDKEYIYADELRINQIFINILSNAIKYTEAFGSVSVDLTEEESEKENCVSLIYKVKDTGIGMSPEFMRNMYQQFSRQVDSRVNSIQGTGLGLAITKRMVDLMQGSIECESIEGKGTTFTVKLDIPISEQRGEMKFNNLSVLIVDDDEILLNTATDTLESLGAVVDKANNGIDAANIISSKHDKKDDYDLIIIDFKMPDMNGIETIKKIRNESLTNTPILLISSYDLSEIEPKAKEAGANGFLSKPLFKSTLYDKINEILKTEAKVAEPENDYSDLAGINVLVAEDYDINYEVIKALLEMYGITTERAINGLDCLNKVKESENDRYTLIFMDIQMPEMNGLEATREIRKLEEKEKSSIPIIALTSDAFSENVTECLNAGMNGHIAKPVDIKLVIKEIRRIMEEKGK